MMNSADLSNRVEYLETLVTGLFGTVLANQAVLMCMKRALVNADAFDEVDMRELIETSIESYETSLASAQPAERAIYLKALEALRIERDSLPG